MIEVNSEEATFGNRVVDEVARFDGSGKFIISFDMVRVT
jgi:uncharacterized membrane protein